MMKRLATLALVASGLAAAPAAAQESQMLELARSNLKTEKVEVVTAAMQLSDSQSTVFWPIYRDFDAELGRIWDGRLAVLRDYGEHQTQMTDTLARSLGRRLLDLEARNTALKKKTVERMSKALSPIVAARFLQVENQYETLIQVQIAEQVPLIHKP